MTNKTVEYLDKLIFIFFCALVFFLPISNSGIEISVGCIFAGMVLKAILRPPSVAAIKQFFSDRVNLAVLVFYVCIGLSLFASGPLFHKSLRAWLAKWGEGVVLFYFARIFLKKEHLKWLLFILLGSTVLVCIDGLYQKVFGVDFLRGFSIKSVDGSAPLRATFSYHTDFATFLVTVFFINFGVFSLLKKRWLQVASAVLALLIMVNMAFTYSRGSWIALLAGSFFLAMFVSDKRIKIAALSVVAVFLAGIFLVPPLRERFLFIVQKGGDSGRFWIWKEAFLIFRDSPLIGCGLGLFMDIFYKYTQWRYHYAHNCYLQMLVETGLVGFIPFMWMIFEIIRKSYVSFRKQVDMLSVGIFAGFLSFLIYAFFDTQLYSLKLSILFWSVAAFLVKSLEQGPAVLPVRDQGADV